MKKLLILCILSCPISTWAAEAGSSDKFAQVRGFKVEISGVEDKKLATSSNLLLLKNKPEDIKLEKMINEMPPVLLFKTVPMTGQVQVMTPQISTVAEDVSLEMEIQSSPYKIVDVLKMSRVQEGLVIEVYRKISNMPALSSVDGTSASAKFHRQMIVSTREAGSGMATGRRSASAPVICEGTCVLRQEVVDLRALLRKFLVGKEGMRVKAIRQARMPGSFNEGLIAASRTLLPVSAIVVSIEQEELLKIELTEPDEINMVANPLYESSGNSGSNPLFEGSSKARMGVIWSPHSNFGGELRCPDGKAKEKNQLCGKTDHF